VNAKADRAIGVALAALALAVYVCALPPSYAFWDTGELQVVSIVFGIAHPPGAPAFVLLGWLFAHLIPFGEPAWRVNLMSAIAVAVAVGVLYATMRLLAIRRPTAAICTLAFAWAQATLLYATRAEVHDLALCFSACALYAAARYERSRATRDLCACALATGLFAATHGVALFFVPAVVLVVIVRPPPQPQRRGAVVAACAAFALGLAPYAYIAPRAAWLAAHHTDPTLAVGLPPGLPFWNYGNPSTPERFWRFVTGAEFHVHSGFAGYADVTRYPAFAAAFVRRLTAAYSITGMLLALGGAVLLVARREPLGRALVLAAVLAVPYTESYSDLQDPDRYYLLALWCAAIAIALAFDGLVATLVERRAPRVVRVALALGLGGIFVSANTTRLTIFQQRQDYTAAQYVDYLRSVTPDDAIILAEWAYSSPLAYASYVRHDFGDRIGAPAGPAQYESDYHAWLAAKRPLYLVSFDSDLALKGYRVRRVSYDQSFYVYEIAR
jgi:hypothetical protein